MRLPRSVRERFRFQGRRGGRRRARRLSATARKAASSSAALRRWIRVRFGAPRFADLGLPGGAAVDRGLDDLAAGRESVESLLVALARPRLRREGVPLPRGRWPDAHRRLYERLESTEGGLAHARYLARLRQISSFADACARARTGRGRRAP